MYTEEELEKIELFAGISLPGLITVSNLDYQEIAKRAFAVAEAMIVESRKIKESCTQK